MQSDILFMQVRLFRAFMERHHLSKGETLHLFQQYEIFEFINDCWEGFHVSSDICALNDIDALLCAKGVVLS